MQRIGPCGGAFLAAGLSGSGRWFPAELLERAVAELRARVDRSRVLVTLGPATEDFDAVCAVVTDVSVQNGVAVWSGELLDTRGGVEIATIVPPDGDGHRAIPATVCGYWRGDVRTVVIDGQDATTADDLVIDRLAVDEHAVLTPT